MFWARFECLFSRDAAMVNMRYKNVRGFTLIEVLVVVAIIGILSAAGVASLRNAVINSRVKDASWNMASFMERISTATKQTGDSLCVVVSGKTLYARLYVGGACSGAARDSFEIEGSFAVVTSSHSISSAVSFAGTPVNWGVSTSPAVFAPHIGISNVIGEGYILANYKFSDRYAAVVKSRKENSFLAFMTKDGGATWEKL